jgi:hypothetical protein
MATEPCSPCYLGNVHGQESTAGSCEYGDEPSGSGATELVSTLTL